MRALRLLTFLAPLALACGGAAPPPTKLGPAPAAETTAALAGSRCANGVCKCREPGEGKEDPLPSDGTKRFEFKIGRGPGHVWVTVNGTQQLYAGTEAAEACFYLDLAAGKHEVVVRGRSAQQGGGVGAALQVREYGTGGNATPWWYDTMVFQCGHPGPCEPDTLGAWKQEVDGYERSLRDPCGSTKVRGAQWETGQLPDGIHPDEFAASVTLDVYEFSPKAGPGDCDKAKAN